MRTLPVSLLCLGFVAALDHAESESSDGAGVTGTRARASLLNIAAEQSDNLLDRAHVSHKSQRRLHSTTSSGRVRAVQELPKSGSKSIKGGKSGKGSSGKGSSGKGSSGKGSKSGKGSIKGSKSLKGGSKGSEGASGCSETIFYFKNVEFKKAFSGGGLIATNGNVPLYNEDGKKIGTYTESTVAVGQNNCNSNGVYNFDFSNGKPSSQLFISQTCCDVDMQAIMGGTGMFQCSTGFVEQLKLSSKPHRTYRRVVVCENASGLCLS